VLRRVRHLIAQRADELAATVDASRVRAPGETLSAEVIPLADACRFLEKNAARLLAARRLGRRGRPAWLTGLKGDVRREPFGLVLVIGPANYPLFLPGVQALQALAAGNAVVLKPAAGGLAAARALADAMADAGLDEALFQVLADSVEAGRAAVAAGPDKVALTGSARTGSAVLEALAEQVVPATVELSGCDAVFVRDDADLDMVVPAVVFGLVLNGGCTCIAPRRVFAPPVLAGQLAERLAAAARELPAVAFPPDTTRALGPLLEEALSHGARIVAGDVRPPRITGPIILSHAAAGMALLKEDVFAPLVSIVPVADDEQALQADAECPYALGAAVFGEESGALELAARVNAGVVVVNDMIVPTADPRVPFGGRDRSGYGVTRGPEGLLEMTRPKAVLVRKGRWRPHLSRADESVAGLARDYLRAAHGASLGARIAGGLAMLRRMAGMRSRS
jgi:acyl-CoA reductase-like NAD-dependent aldehyde dehydrogenase